jgi:hypothetical protein
LGVARVRTSLTTETLISVARVSLPTDEAEILVVQEFQLFRPDFIPKPEGYDEKGSFDEGVQARPGAGVWACEKAQNKGLGSVVSPALRYCRRQSPMS